jgi:class 3 adenylate cyclase
MDVIEAVTACVTGASLASISGLGTARRRRRMARHLTPTFVFADLVGYTALTEQRGDRAAARVADEFRRAMAALSRNHGAWQVKSMGDGVMIWSPDSAEAIALAATVVAELGTRPDLLPVRVGAHTGPAVMHGEDWYGGAVNVAARLSREARPNEVLLSGATRRAAVGRSAWPLEARGELMLRGLTDPVAVWGLAPSASPE